MVNTTLVIEAKIWLIMFFSLINFLEPLLQCYNAVIFKKNISGEQVSLPSSISDHSDRLCAAKLIIAGKETLVVSYHGPYKTHKFEKNTDGNSDPETIKRRLLVNLLKEFHSAKEKKEDGVIFGGDFNLNIKTFVEENKSLLNELGLTLVPVNDGGGRKKQIDGLFCIFDISNRGNALTGKLLI